MLTIQNQTRGGKIFKCTFFVGYGGVIFFTGVAPAGSINFSLPWTITIIKKTIQIKSERLMQQLSCLR